MASKTVRGRRGCSQCGDRWGGRSGDKTWHPLGKAAAARTAWVALVASDGGGTPSGSPDKPRSVMTLASRGTFPWASRDQVRTSPGEPSGNRRRNSPYGVSGEVSVTCGHCGAVGYALRTAKNKLRKVPQIRGVSPTRTHLDREQSHSGCSKQFQPRAAHTGKGRASPFFSQPPNPKEVRINYGRPL